MERSCAVPFWPIFCWSLTLFDNIWPIWTRLFGPIWLDLSIWTCLFSPLYFDMSLRPVYLSCTRFLDLSIGTCIFGPVHLQLSVLIRLFGPVYLGPFIWSDGSSVKLTSMNYVQFSLLNWINQNMKIMIMRGQSGAMIFFGKTIHLPLFFFKFHARSSLWLCVAGVTKGPKTPLKRPLHTLRTA